MVNVQKLFLAAVAASTALSALGQNAPSFAPVPSDPLELASGAIQVANTPEDRAAVLTLLNHARRNYLLRTAATGYDVKVSFTANSGSLSQYDGAWQMEEIFIPNVGVRWTAKGAAYSTVQIRSQNLAYGDAPASNYPLVLHEARGALFGPMPTAFGTSRDLIRTTNATLNGAQLTCVLLSGAGNPSTPAEGRGWNEIEECIDSHSGLLTVHSLAPGRYALYDYANAPQFHGHVLPRKITITEAGNPVLELHVDSLEDFSSTDPNVFTPTAQMKANGAATEMGQAFKFHAFPGGRRMPLQAGAAIQPVVIFGMLTPSGDIVEAHSLQPANPNSEAALEAAKSMNWRMPTPPGGPPLEHFVFVFENFISAQQ